jgi:hypothetical protein
MSDPKVNTYSVTLFPPTGPCVVYDPAENPSYSCNDGCPWIIFSYKGQQLESTLPFVLTTKVKNDA